ncbi:Gamma-secretase subunit Aph-1 family-containing protein [Strongyloides ratti]|uniref:Gamma-secretase subunit Aph-1 family-containing protein n=1 Tax=Strongyloides ratti TaxID=34506 RepID=A0A090L558_STRRB|nr:Gamma-secretase subunit Aph-1 family-containing protein [Strongyloides ratti]CEF64941.1 Gamma-secretase subunit Aph-1 family-containing protein [Strongyloides ratti]
MIENINNTIALALSLGPIIPFLLYGTYFRPIQIAIVFYGAFIQILAILLSSIIWKFGSQYYQNITLYISILIFNQEIFRIFLYYIIRRCLLSITSSTKYTKDRESSELSKYITEVSFAAGFGIGIVFQVLYAMNNISQNSIKEILIIKENYSIINTQDIINIFNLKNIITNKFLIIFPCINLPFNILWTMLIWTLLHKIDN